MSWGGSKSRSSTQYGYTPDNRQQAADSLTAAYAGGAPALQGPTGYATNADAAQQRAVAQEKLGLDYGNKQRGVAEGFANQGVATAQTAIGDINSARGATGDAQDAFGRGEAALSDRDFYRDPYNENVIDATLADMTDEFDRQGRERGAGAASAGAFGGSRHGIADATSGRLQSREMGDYANKMRSEAERFSGEMALNRGRGIMEAGQGHLNTADRYLGGAQGTLGMADREFEGANQFRGMGIEGQQGYGQMAESERNIGDYWTDRDMDYRKWIDANNSRNLVHAQNRLAGLSGIAPTQTGATTTTRNKTSGTSRLIGAGLTAASMLSSEELKENIVDVEAGAGLGRILELHPTEFHYIEPEHGTGRRRGFIAEEVEQSDPDAVTILLDKDGEERKAVDFAPIIADLTDAVQTLHERIEHMDDGTVEVELEAA